MGVHKMADKIENKEIAVQVSGVKKKYKLGQIGGGSLQADLQSWWARVRGKEDPNSKIGEDQRSNGKTFMALNGVDLTIYKGEAVGIIGGNGAGKSTLLKLLSRVTAPTEGSIDIYGRIASMLEVGTGFNPEMTGRENVYLNGAILGMTKAEIDAKMEQIIEFSEVREFIDTPVKRYSSGMFVKLAFSVAAHLDSEIMIMDEVLAVGDMAFQKKCLDKMRDAAKQEGRTVLYVSHNMNTIRTLCDRCIVLDKGKVVFQGDVEKAISIYTGYEEKIIKTEYTAEDLQWNSSFAVLRKDAKFKKLNILNYEVALSSTDNLQIKVLIDVEKLYDKMQMGFQLYTASLETLGFGYSKLDKIQTGENELYFKFKLENLTEGTYCFRLNLHTVDDTNSYLGSIDQTNYIYFNVNRDFHDMAWHKEWWNHFKLVEFKQVQNIEEFI